MLLVMTGQRRVSGQSCEAAHVSAEPLPDPVPDEQSAYCCPYCHVRGTWTVMRRGDVAVSWACPAHLSRVCLWMQRDHEVTELVVTHSAKAAEWAAINEALLSALPDTVCTNGTCQLARGHAGRHRDGLAEWGPPQ